MILMLILSRKATEEIVIDGRIRVAILSIRGNRVKVGITAPSDVAVLRTECTESRPRADTPGCVAVGSRTDAA
jgi:carbon storage regulator